MPNRLLLRSVSRSRLPAAIQSPKSLPNNNKTNASPRGHPACVSGFMIAPTLAFDNQYKSWTGLVSAWVAFLHPSFGFIWATSRERINRIPGNNNKTAVLHGSVYSMVVTWIDERSKEQCGWRVKWIIKVTCLIRCNHRHKSTAGRKVIFFK